MDELRYKYLNALQYEIDGVEDKLKTLLKIKGAPSVELGVVINWLHDTQNFIDAEYGKIINSSLEEATIYDCIDEKKEDDGEL